MGVGYLRWGNLGEPFCEKVVSVDRWIQIRSEVLIFRDIVWGRRKEEAWMCESVRSIGFMHLGCELCGDVLDWGSGENHGVQSTVFTFRKMVFLRHSSRYRESQRRDQFWMFNMAGRRLWGSCSTLVYWVHSHKVTELWFSERVVFVWQTSLLSSCIPTDPLLSTISIYQIGINVQNARQDAVAMAISQISSPHPTSIQILPSVPPISNSLWSLAVRVSYWEQRVLPARGASWSFVRHGSMVINVVGHKSYISSSLSRLEVYAFYVALMPSPGSNAKPASWAVEPTPPPIKPAPPLLAGSECPVCWGSDPVEEKEEPEPLVVPEALTPESVEPSWRLTKLSRVLMVFPGSYA